LVVMRSYTVIGVGAIGGYYGARLHQAGHPVRFLARSDADALRAHGLRVDSPEGDAVLAVDVHDDPAEVPVSDTLIVATKTTANDQVAEVVEQLAAGRGPGGRAAGDRPTTVLVMQNGLGIERTFAARAPEATVLGAMCFMCCNKIGPGHIRHLDYGAVTVGQHTDDGSAAGVTPAVQAVLDDLQGAGVATTPVESLATGRWQKLVWNMPFNGLSVVHDATTDALVGDPAIRARAVAIMGEVVDAAEACGHPLDRSFIDRQLANTEAMTPYLPSMKLDHDSGRALELDAIYEAPTRAARAAGAPMVEAEALLAELRVLDPGQPTGWERNQSRHTDENARS
jgi:2-dehydropantoate 2-reductase